MIGDQNCGKTSLVSRYISDKFSNKIQATVAWEYSRKLLTVKGNTVKLNVWDIAGQDRLGGVSKLFWRNAAGAIVVSDIVQEDTLEDVIEWKEQVDAHWGVRPSGDTVPMVLAVNKYDLIEGYEEGGKEVEPFMTQKYIQEFAN